MFCVGQPKIPLNKTERFSPQNHVIPPKTVEHSPGALG